MKIFPKIYGRHKQFWHKEQFWSLGFSLVVLTVAIIIQNLMDRYVATTNGPAVGDLILNHIPTLDIDVILVQGSLFTTLVGIILCLARPQYLTITLKSVSLFIVVRAFFISLTHLGISPQQLTIDPNNFGYTLYNLLYNSKGGDFFFSGHTGSPFLLALIFWDQKLWRGFFLMVSLVMGAGVLFAHIHYSIDVFAAPFMTYGIFAISKILFAKDFRSVYSPKPLA
jgi:hypothetical protein